MRPSSCSVLLMVLTACGASSQPDAGLVEDAGVVEDAGMVMDFSTGRKILAYLEGKTMVMTGQQDIPSSPNGISEAFALGANTQCYRAITLQVDGGAFISTIERGRLTTPSDGETSCEHTVTTGTAHYTSKAVLVDNVQDNGRCFDITIDYTTFGEEGRGMMSPDGGFVTLELYYRGKATQHRCEDGPVGARTVHLLVGGGSSVLFTENSLEVFRIQ